jgi:hypothetical protein
MRNDRIGLTRSILAAVVPTLLGILMGSADRAGAATITLTNPGFDILTGGADSTGIATYSYYDGTINGWSQGEILGNLYTYPNTYYEITPTSGSIVADITTNLAFYQTTGYAIQATDQYTLTFSAGLREGENGTPLTAELLDAANSNTLASMTISTLTTTAFATAHPGQMDTYVLPALAPTILQGDIGNDLEVEFVGGSTGGQDSIDTVSLSVVPEPASLGILGAATIALLTRRRRSGDRTRACGTNRS